ncbi:MAG: hypothetical protein IH627_01270 [Rubrivivax sp.]|nr:hypothetical protein [Rubrivivax sp.]
MATSSAHHSDDRVRTNDGGAMPHWRGNADLISLLAGVPVDRMPWKTYTLG